MPTFSKNVLLHGAPTSTLAASQVHQLKLCPEWSLSDAVSRGGAGRKGRGQAGRGRGACRGFVRWVVGGEVGTATAWTPPLLLGGAPHVHLGTL